MGKKNFCHAIYAFFFSVVRLNFVALSSNSVHVSLKMELEIKFSKSRSKFSLNNDNLGGNCFRLIFILHFFFGTKIDVNFHYNVKTVLYTGATE